MASVQLGPWLNLIPALLFWALSARWLGRWGGITALGGYLFWNAQSPSYIFATYTPWLFASHFAQGLFCATLLAWQWARQRPALWSHAVVGLLHGLTFMAHTGPALLLGIIFCLHTLFDLVSPTKTHLTRKAVGARLLLTLGVAFLASLPYTGPILLRYQMHVLNIFPTINIESPMQLAELGGLLWGTLNVINVIALVGLIHLLRARDPEQQRVTLAWLLAVSVWLIQGYAWQYFGWMQRGIPQIVPAHHAHAAATLLRALCFGAGLIALTRIAAKLPLLEKRGKAILLPVAIGLSIALALPGYLHFPDFGPEAHQDQPLAEITEQRNHAYQWIRDNVQPDATVLTDDWLAILAVGPAARGSVATLLIFSNPYIDAFKRLGDRDRLFDALRAKDEPAFLELAKQYNVSCILATGPEERIVRAARFASISEALAVPPLTVFALAYPPPATNAPHGTPDR